MTEKIVVRDIYDDARPMSEEDSKRLRDAVVPMGTVLAGLPENIRLRVVTSLIVSLCMNTDDPGGTFEVLGREAHDAIHRAIEQDRKSGGRA